jgi:hypothetical protein
VIENCAMQSWHPDGYPGNLAYLPELWDWLIAHGLALNFDPSHLLPLGIDPVVALGDYVEQVAHPTPQGVIGGLLWERPSLQVSRGSHAPDRAKGVLACGRE